MGLAVRCGFCARGECRFGADCKRVKRVEENAGMRAKSVAKRRVQRRLRQSSGKGRTTKKKTAGKDVGHDENVADTRPYVFGRKRVGVAGRPPAVGERVVGLVRLVCWHRWRRMRWRSR